ncbi:MAG TPA: hypothetical protein VF523_12935 [Burkholderiales bacterium]
MTDLEMTKLCAEAMGIVLDGIPSAPSYFDSDKTENGCIIFYDPIHDDAQAMALVKKFGLCIEQYAPDSASGSRVYLPGYWKRGVKFMSNLNRAIVECVARMQAAKKEV